MEDRIIAMLKDIKQLIIKKTTEDKWLDINQASEYCSVHPSTLRRSMKSGDLIHSKKLGKSLFKKSELENWLS